MQADWSKTEGNPLRENLLTEAAEIRHGPFIELPRGPGLGVVLNEDVVDRYRIEA